MSHEIYYTSAPQGLKRGSSGFSTVAASDNIPRALWDRLETLSAYRHHFPAANGQNPVSHAHWLLNIANTTYHVLSRICDSGVDHTQRTNAFAHHLVLEASEMAAGGPAWMLQRSGVMADAWDGQVGPIAPHPLPGGGAGNASPAICRAWQRAAGDAGWGGHLADIFVKSAGKPVCILFSPGQEILPLLTESIALLPPLARWQVTFNTYFTSMPTSATCVWRCCLAGTPAAQIALRYAASGVVINLADPSRLGAVPAGPYVTLARTGQAPIGVTKAAAAPAPTAARPAVAAAAIRTPPTRLTPGDSAPAGDPTPPPVAEDFSSYEITETAAKAPAAGRSSAFLPHLPRPRPRLGAVPAIRSADAALRSAEAEAAGGAGRGAARRRRQVLWLLGGALVLLGVGTAMMVRIMKNAGPPEVLVAPGHTAVAVHGSGEIPRDVTPVSPVSPPVWIPQPAIATRSTPPPAPSPAPRAPIPTAQKPGTIVVATLLELPTAGAGIADFSQTLIFPARDLDPFPISEVRLVFPNGKSEYTLKDPPGSLLATSGRLGGRHTVTLQWKDSGMLDVAVITFERNRSAIEIEWKSAAMLKRPEVVLLAYWAIQASALNLESRRATDQRIAFKGLSPQAVPFTDASTALAIAGRVPPQATVTAPAGLPPGWQVTWYTDWGNADAALRTPETATQVLKFHKPGSSEAVESWFTLRFAPGFAKVESNFQQRAAADGADYEKAQSEERAMAETIKQKSADAGVATTDDRFKPYLAKQAELERVAEAYKSAAAGYKELTDFDVALSLPGGVRLTTIHFAQANK